MSISMHPDMSTNVKKHCYDIIHASGAPWSQYYNHFRTVVMLPRFFAKPVQKLSLNSSRIGILVGRNSIFVWISDNIVRIVSPTQGEILISKFFWRSRLYFPYIDKCTPLFEHRSKTFEIWFSQISWYSLVAPAGFFLPSCFKSFWAMLEQWGAFIDIGEV